MSMLLIYLEAEADAQGVLGCAVLHICTESFWCEESVQEMCTCAVFGVNALR